jgi:hypothetical protein
LEAERQAVIDWLVAAQHQVVHSYRPSSDTVRDGCLAAAEPYFAKEPPGFTRLITSSVTASLGEEHARELRARGADFGRDQAVAYTLTQALDQLESVT